MRAPVLVSGQGPFIFLMNFRKNFDMVCSCGSGHLLPSAALLSNLELPCKQGV